MNISRVNIKLNEEDLLSIIKEFVSVNGLKIENIILGENITVNGSYKKGIKVPFKAIFNIYKIENNIINIKIDKIFLYKVSIAKGIIRIILKSIRKKIIEFGVVPSRFGLDIDINVLTKNISGISFSVNNITLFNHYIMVEASKVFYTEKKETLESNETKKEENDIENNKNKYEIIRNSISEYVNENRKSIFEYAMFIPDIVTLSYRIMKDKRVGKYIKITIGALLTYIALPIDVLPDNIPFIGQIDDISIALFIFNKILKEIPEEIIIDNWPGEKETINKVKETCELLSKHINKKNISRIIAIISIGKKTLRKKGKNR